MIEPSVAARCARRSFAVSSGAMAMAVVFGVSAVLHVAAVVIVQWRTNGVPAFPDSAGYDMSSSVVAGAWHLGLPLTSRNLASWTGSQLWGYPTLMALAKVVTGGGWLAAKVVLALLAATGAVAAYTLATVSGRGGRRAAVAGLAVGASPTLLLWDAWGLKDGLITTLVLWTLVVQTRARFWLASAVTLVSIQACLYLRPATALFLAVALLARVRPRREQVTGVLILAAAAFVIVLPRLAVLAHLVNTLQVQDGTALRFSGGYGSRNVLDHPQYLVDLLFGPFPWAYGSGTATPERWLYPGTALWIACLALAPAAVRRAWQDGDGIGRAAILGGAAYGATYLDTFGATFYRQRSLLECMLVLVIVLYLPLPVTSVARRVHLWLGIVACVALLQNADLTPTNLSKALVALTVTAGLVWIAAPNPVSMFARRLERARVSPGDHSLGAAVKPRRVMTPQSAGVLRRAVHVPRRRQ
jgi:hypothetical protein